MYIHWSEADPCAGVPRALHSSVEGRSLNAGTQEKQLNVRLAEDTKPHEVPRAHRHWTKSGLGLEERGKITEMT